MGKLTRATNPLTGKSIDLLSPWVWVAGVLFVVFAFIIFGAGKWVLEKGKGITGIGQPEGAASLGNTLLGGFS